MKVDAVYERMATVTGLACAMATLGNSRETIAAPAMNGFGKALQAVMQSAFDDLETATSLIRYMEQADIDLIQHCVSFQEECRMIKHLYDLEDLESPAYEVVNDAWWKDYKAIISTRARHPDSLKAKARILAPLTSYAPDRVDELAGSLVSDILGED